MRTRLLEDLIRPAGTKAGEDASHPVFSVTKHDGFVLSSEYFKKQVFSRELSGYKRVRPGDFAYATIHLDEGSIGVAPADGLISPMYTVFRPMADLVDPNYLLRYLKSPVALAQYPQFGKGSVHRRKSISLAALGKLPVPLPRLDEQRRIAAILSDADGPCVKRRRVINLLDDLDSSIFFEMFGDPSGRSKGWARTTLGELIAEGPQNGLYKASSEYGQGVPIVRIDSFQDGSPIDIDRLKRVRVSEAESELYGLAIGDIVVNRVNSRSHLGKSTVVSGLTEVTLFESNMMRLRLDTRKVLPEYVVAFLGTPYAKNQIQAAGKDAVNQSSINQKDVASFDLPLPPIEIQTKYLSRYCAAKQLRTKFVISLGRFDHLFNSLQSRAFSGQL